MSAPDVPPTVVLPAGPPLLEAAAWVGRACWAELSLHELLTVWLADAAEPAEALAFWSIRSARAEAGEAWHRRLPELREFPRSTFIAPAHPDLAGVFSDAEAAPAAHRSSVLVALLSSLGRGYRAHVDVARGPADGPVSHTLAREIARVDEGISLVGVEADPVWVSRLDGSGVL